MKSKRKLVSITLVAVMTALSTVIYFLLPEIPLVPGVEYLKIDLSDLPAILTSFVCGPSAGFLVELFKNAFHLLRTTTYGIGELVNVGVGGVIVYSVYLFSKLFSKLFHKTLLHPASYFVSAAVTVAVTVLAGWLINAVLTPVYFALMGWDCSFVIVKAGVIGSTLLNVIKAAVDLFPFYPLYFAAFRLFNKK